jgi:hypothetical protein
MVDSLAAGVNNGTVTIGTFDKMLPVTTAAIERTVVTSPLWTYRQILSRLLHGELRKKAERHVAAILTPRLAAVDEPGGAESPEEAAVLRRYLVNFLALDAHSAELRRQLKQAAHTYIGYRTDARLHPDALQPDILITALTVAVQDSSPEFVDALIEQLEASDNQRLRQAMTSALAYATDPAVLGEIRNLMLSDAVRANERQTWLSLILNDDSRDENWPWVQENLDLILAEGSDRITRDAPNSFGRWFCSPEEAEQLKAAFEDRVDQYIGSRRIYEQTLESIRLCVAFKERHAKSAAEYFSKL